MRTVTAISMPLVMPAASADTAADRDLVARLRDGDRDAVEQAYLAHHAAIRGFAPMATGVTVTTWPSAFVGVRI